MINQMEATRKTHKIKYGLSFPCLSLCHPPVYLIFLPQLKSRKALGLWSNAVWISSLWHEWVASFLSNLPFPMPHACRTVEDRWDCQVTVSYTLIHAPTAMTVNFSWWETLMYSDVSIYAPQLFLSFTFLANFLWNDKRNLQNTYFRVKHALFHRQLLLFHSMTFPQASDLF